MAIVCKDGTEKIVYVAPPQDALEAKSESLLNEFMKYARIHELSEEEICIQKALIPRIILRVDKREGYFMVFHEQTRINEIKQAALTAYWILKFRPFMINTLDLHRANHFRRINEGFAAFYLISAFKQYSIEKGNKIIDISDRLINEILYAFSYWDLSKESMILVAESIGEAFFGIKAEGILEDGDN